MKKSFYTILLSGALFFSVPAHAQNSGVWLGFGGGYSNGFGGGAEISLIDMIPGFPLSFHFNVGYYHQTDPGNAVTARRIFINNATAGNDNILEYGYNIFFRLDFSYLIFRKDTMNIDIYAGVAYARHLAHFDYQGGNEAFDVTTNPWGATGGVRVYFYLTRKLLLTFSGGVEYYFPDRISGHGNFYNPDGLDDNPLAPYTYVDADTAILQPAFSPRATLAISFRL